MAANAQKLRCVETTAAGKPCRAWAMPGDERCSIHLRIAGRYEPWSLTPDVTERLAQIISAGSYIQTACTAVGVPRQTFYQWWVRGDPSRAQPGDEPYRAFRTRMEQARAEGEARLVTLIAKAAQESWQAAAWLLEREFPERWGRVSVSARDLTPAPMPVAETPAVDDPFAEADELARLRSRRAASE